MSQMRPIGWQSCWVLWSGGSGTGEDPFVSDAHSLSPSNSVAIVPYNDLVKPLGDLTSGKYSIAFMVYIPTGKEGQFVTLSGFTSGWGEFAMAVLFRPGGSGSVDGGAQGAATFTYAYDTWQSVEVIVDLDEDEGQFWFDGDSVHTWQWTLGSWGTGSALQLAASDIFGVNVNDEMYIDDFEFWDMIVPVELTSFTATTQTGKVYLNWATATELNNLGFEVERKILNNQNEGEWVRIGFKEGYGTTTEPKEYSFVDDISDFNATSTAYRLKQIDFDGSYEYSEEVLVETLAPVNFVLEQNYPNPFNPATTISFGIPVKSIVVLKVFNSIGEQVANLVNEEKAAGAYSVAFDATNFPSGVYFYQLRAGSPSTSSGQSFVETKKMILLK